MLDEPANKDIDFEIVAKITEGFSGSDLHELCRSASVYRMRDYMKTNNRWELFKYCAHNIYSYTQLLHHFVLNIFYNVPSLNFSASIS